MKRARLAATRQVQSLRRYEPDQVRRISALPVTALAVSQPLGGDLPGTIFDVGPGARRVNPLRGTQNESIVSNEVRSSLRLRPGDVTREVATANGLVRVAPIRLGSVQIGSIVVRDVEAVAVPRVRLRTGPLGMSFLKRLRDFSTAGGRLTLRG